MVIEKINSHQLEKCYAVERIWINDHLHIIAASEARSACLLFDVRGNYVEKIWDQPGGTMSLVALREKSARFLASQQFYGPDASSDSKIVLAERSVEGKWQISDVMKVPYLHRFDILKRNGVSYLLAATIKEHSEYQEDWRTKGKLLVSGTLGEIHDIKLRELELSLVKNHGFYRLEENDYEYALVSGDEGVFKVIPPADICGRWSVRQILAEPVSDMVMIDLDGDGEEELVTISPFHGDDVSIYKKVPGGYVRIYQQQAQFAHAIWGGLIYGKPAVVLGHRYGERNLLVLTMDTDVKIQVIEADIGPANVLCYEDRGIIYLVSANRETDQVSFYRIKEG